MPHLEAKIYIYIKNIYKDSVHNIIQRASTQLLSSSCIHTDKRELISNTHSLGQEHNILLFYTRKISLAFKLQSTSSKIKFSYTHEHNWHPTKPVGCIHCIQWKQSNFSLILAPTTPSFLNICGSAPVQTSSSHRNVHVMHIQLFAPASSIRAAPFCVSLLIRQSQKQLAFSRGDPCSSQAAQRLCEVRAAFCYKALVKGKSTCPYFYPSLML